MQPKAETLGSSAQAVETQDMVERTEVSGGERDTENNETFQTEYLKIPKRQNFD